MNPLLYNKDLDQKLSRLLQLPPQLSLADEDFLDYLIHQNQASADPPPSGPARAEYLFYLLTRIGRLRPALFPVPDINLAVFNLLAARHGAENSLTGRRLVCLDLALLPAAVLAAGLGAKVAPPPGFRLKSWPRSLFSDALTADRNLAGALVLGRDPLKLIEADPGLPARLAEAAGGFIFCFWDFLGVNLHKHARRKWLEAGVVVSILQLPRPRRQTVVYYPALLEIGPPARTVRLADIRKVAPGPGGLNQTEVLRVLRGPPNGQESRDLTVEKLANQAVIDFTPRRYLSESPAADRRPLGDYAEVLRCQIPRTRLTEEEVSKVLDFRDGSLLCREISLANLEERSGFIQAGGGQAVRLNRFSGRDESHLLRKHDILLSFRGTEGNIGRAGLADASPDEPLIAGQSLCLIRVFNGAALDHVWLYYYLRREEVRRRIVNRCSGSSMLTVNLGDLRRLSLPRPTEAQVEACRKRHSTIINLMAELRELQSRLQTEMKALEEASFQKKADP